MTKLTPAQQTELKARFYDRLLTWGIPLLVLCLAYPILQRIHISGQSSYSAMEVRCKTRKDNIAGDLGRTESEIAETRAAIAAGDEADKSNPNYYHENLKKELLRAKALLQELEKPCP